jgi:hypothetical protein
MSERTCMVDNCGRPKKHRGLCNRHYLCLIRNGDPLALRGVPRGERCSRWVGDQATYHTVHARIAAARGRAAEQICAHCDGPAAEWAYDHTDPNARTDERGLEYSLDLCRYIPLCGHCHNWFDATYDFANRTHCTQGHDIKHTVVIGRVRPRYRCRKCHAAREKARTTRLGCP